MKETKKLDDQEENQKICHYFNSAQFEAKYVVDPRTSEEALSGVHSNKKFNAMKEEMINMQKNQA